jgi:hypothetical protein
MPSYIQIEGDPAKWWIEDQVPTSELTGATHDMPAERPGTTSPSS